MELRREMLWLGDRFARQVTRVPDTCRVGIFLLGGLLILAPWLSGREAAGAGAPALKPNTVAAFEQYVKLTEARNAEELQRGTNLLWIDSLKENERAQAYEALKGGEVKVQKLETRANGEKIHCPDGMIHHWVGVAFIPKAKIHDVLYLSDSDRREHSRSSAMRIAEVENAGKPNEREKAPGDDGGYLWRMETWWRMDERDGGVYVQSEVVSLTRDIPKGLGWLIGPFVNSIPKETLAFTLGATRKAVQEKDK